MNIVIPDIDTYLLDLVDLQSMAILQQVNKYFHKIISAKPITDQWETINDIKLKLPDKFKGACEMDFLEYAEYLIGVYEIDMHVDNEYTFRWSCVNGHFEIDLVD